MTLLVGTSPCPRDDALLPTLPDVMSAATQASVYQPFPSFGEWAMADVSLGFVDTFIELLNATRSTHDEAHVAAAVREMSRAAAVDTNAIEGLYTTDRGFTRTVATEAAAWQAVAQQRGEHVLALINSALEAYDFVLDAATGSRPVTEAWIRELHEVLCRTQDTYLVHTAAGPQEQPLTRGAYKTMPNNPTSLSTGRIHHYASPADTPSEMARLVAELRSEGFNRAHPALQASYAHYAFVCVHPFADGNGRVARALASVFTYREPGVPLVVYADQRDAYLDALERADEAEYSSFIDFVAQRLVDVVELVRIAATTPRAPRPAESLHKLQRASLGIHGLPHTAVDGIAQRLNSLFAEEVRRQGGDIELPAGGTLQVSDTPSRVRFEGYRLPPGTNSTVVTLTQGHPASTSVEWYVSVSVALPDQVGPEFVLASKEGLLDVRMRDIHPTETQLLRLKLETHVSGHLARMLADLAEKTQRSLKSKGYI